jgi:tetrapyrrole methylase family protein / MazG family protein
MLVKDRRARKFIMSQRKRSSKQKRRKVVRGGGAPNRARIPISARDRAAGKWFEKLVALQARLRGPNGCPWDREQSHESLRKFLIEETYEVLDAMESGDPRKFSSELGDLLLQVVFHSILAEESGGFTISDVIESVHTKMVRRHPHVFGSAKAGTSAAVLKSWEQIKAEERATEGKASGSASAAPDSILGGVPRSLPAVLEAYQLTRRASHVGFDWENLAGIFDKLDEEKHEIESMLRSSAPARTGTKASAPHLEEEVGDLLFVGVNIARFLGVDPEIALRSANRKFKQRFQRIESAAAREGRRFADLPRERMEELWNQAKTEV